MLTNQALKIGIFRCPKQEALFKDKTGCTPSNTKLFNSAKALESTYIHKYAIGFSYCKLT